MPAAEAQPPLLAVRGLAVSFPGTGDDEVVAVAGVDLDLHPGEAVGLVGESGAGKTLTALALVALLPPAARVRGTVELAGAGDILRLPEPARRRLRGGRLAMVFQDAGGALDPTFTIGSQIREALALHRGLRGTAARAEAVRLLDLVAMPAAAERVDSYPHELSGGQRQRAMIAIAVAGEPEVLIADEPTTALDVTLEAQVLALLADLRRELGLTLLLVTHDLAAVAGTCDRAVVMHRGAVVERASVGELFARPVHPYTRELVAVARELAAEAP